MLGLPDGVVACLFDLDGVLTDTASVHDAAWTEMFNAFLKARDGDGFTPFDPEKDYGQYVDGKPRYDGVRDFLASRGITLPEGSPDDASDAQTVCGLGNAKNDIVQRRIHDDGVKVFDDARRYLEAATEAGLRRAVVSSSANTEDVLAVTGLAQFVELRVDGVTIREEGLKGKPAPDTFIEGARRLGLEPAQAAVFEDALAGVAAGRAGGFGAVVGVNRLDDEHGRELKEHGATVVVRRLDELL